MLDDDGKPTPRVTGSWAVFKDLALALAVRLERAAVAKRSINLLVRDPEGAGQFLERAKLLRWMSVQFAKWPDEPEKAAVERPTLGSLLLTLQRESEEVLTKMMGGPW